MIDFFLEFCKFVCISGQVNLAKFTWPDLELQFELYLSALKFLCRSRIMESYLLLSSCYGVFSRDFGRAINQPMTCIMIFIIIHLVDR